jgi:hypothetical protein
LCENFPGATIYLTTKSEKITPQVKKGMKVVFERDKIDYFLVFSFISWLFLFVKLLRGDWMKRKVGRTFLREIIINNNIGKLVTTNQLFTLIFYVFLVKSEDERRLWTCERALRVHSPGCDRQGTRPTTIYFP